MCTSQAWVLWSLCRVTCVLSFVLPGAVLLLPCDHPPQGPYSCAAPLLQHRNISFWGFLSLSRCSLPDTRAWAHGVQPRGDMDNKSAYNLRINLADHEAFSLAPGFVLWFLPSWRRALLGRFFNTCCKQGYVKSAPHVWILDPHYIWCPSTCDISQWNPHQEFWAQIFLLEK